ncbi:hypothetical protein BV22DRAFT_15306 [Leucogyrophana mollusca]|uniref:Uncharacterized protein n=1 Tax=Leucogyrophana mollusca TaxID=85980 RepID=A0ACB8C0Q8_9AGAM|nr:hypothetical protein BV22DRAFT_15306 [Leucogyrophana mollusca]
MSAMSSLPVSVVRALDIGKQSRAGALGLLIYERFIVFGAEIDLIWSHKRNWVKYLYIFNGWLALIWLTFDMIPLSPSGVVSSKMQVYQLHSQCIHLQLSSTRCIIYLIFDDVITLLMTVSVQAILQLRVWAIYGRSRKMYYFLVATSALEVATMIALIVMTLSSIENLPIISTPTGCSYEGLLPLSALFWTPALIVEPILCTLVLRKALYSIRGHGSLSAMLARDSIFVELTASTIVWAHFPDYINIFMPWSAALPSLLGNRLLLNMREHFAPRELHTEFELTTMAPRQPEESQQTDLMGDFSLGR